jgi:hypothetical protein
MDQIPRPIHAKLEIWKRLHNRPTSTSIQSKPSNNLLSTTKPLKGTSCNHGRMCVSHVVLDTHSLLGMLFRIV